MTIEVHYDLSAAFGPARQQGQRPTCMAFAMSDLSRFYAKSPVLSAEFLYQRAASTTPGWKPGDGTYIEHAIAATFAPGLPGDDFFPYQAIEPTLPLVTLPLPTSANELHRTKFTSGKISGTSYVRTMLQTGHPVGLVVRVTMDLFRPKSGLVAYSPMVLPNQLHAIVATGYGTHVDSSEPYVRVRNSWGPGWAEQGHAWIHADYIDNHTVNTFKV
jgi:hypothetical protein